MKEHFLYFGTPHRTAQRATATYTNQMRGALGIDELINTLAAFPTRHENQKGKPVIIIIHLYLLFVANKSNRIAAIKYALISPNFISPSSSFSTFSSFYSRSVLFYLFFIERLN